MPNKTQPNALETYRPSSRFGLMSIPMMLVIGGALGIASAFIVHLIWQLTGFYLIFIFPAGMGFAAGAGLRIGIKAGKNRNVVVGMSVGLVIGAFSYVSMHYFDSVSYGAPDPMSYLREIADVGYTVFFIPISGPLAWLSWILEMGVVIFLAVSIAGGSASEPYCEDDSQWCKERTLFASSNKSAEDIVAALNEGEYHRLKDLRTEPISDRNQLRADVQYCDKCFRKGYLTLTSVTPKDEEEKEEEELVSNVAIGVAVSNLLKDFPAETS